MGNFHPKIHGPNDSDKSDVFPAENGQFKAEGQQYMKILRSNGLETLPYYGYDKKAIFVLIKANIDVLRNYADDIDFVMLLDPTFLANVASTGNPEHGIAPFSIADLPEVSKFGPYEYIYGKYSCRMDERLYYRREGEEHPFFDSLRLKLTSQLVEKTNFDGGKLRIKRSIEKLKSLLAYFPLHDRKELESLRSRWYSCWIVPWKQPFNDITRYFGEKISIYFLFMGHYSWWCLLAAIVGIPLQVAVFWLNDYSAPFLPFFSYFIALWGILMLEFWKRKESEWAMKWGTLGCETTETDRADFEGTPMKSYIDGKDIFYFSSAKKKQLASQSLLGVTILICLVIGAVTSIYIIRFTLQEIVGTVAQTIASIINSIQIQISSAIYYSLATALNERENHRTDTLHEDSLIGKIFLFDFVNNYASFFYLAFFAEIMLDCPLVEDGGCMFPLTTNLAIIFVTRIVTGNLLVILPLYFYRGRVNTAAKDTKTDVSTLSQPEREFLLEPYDCRAVSIAQFTDLSIQFGYASMFAAALPISSFLALVSTFAGTKKSAWMLLNLHRRPQPLSCEDIGTWQSILTIVSIISVVTNSSLTVFTMDVTDNFSDFRRFWIYIGFQWTCFLIQVVIMSALPDVSESVSIQQDRTSFLVEKVIDQTPDDELEEFTRKEPIPIVIQPHPLKEKQDLSIPKLLPPTSSKHE